MSVAAVTLEHDRAEYFDVGDVVQIDASASAIGRVLHVDVPGERITVDFFGVLRRAWWALRHR